MKNLLLLLIPIVILSACGKKGDDPTPELVYPPTTIYASSITLNNMDTTAMPNGETALSAYVELYSSDGVLLAKSYDLNNLTTMPAQLSFYNPSTFSYNFKIYKLKFYGVYSTTPRLLGTIDLALSEYDNGSIPKPQTMFFNKSGFAGTLTFGYQ